MMSKKTSTKTTTAKAPAPAPKAPAPAAPKYYVALREFRRHPTIVKLATGRRKLSATAFAQISPADAMFCFRQKDKFILINGDKIPIVQ